MSRESTDNSGESGAATAGDRAGDGGRVGAAEPGEAGDRVDETDVEIGGASVELRDLTKTYGDATAVDGIDLAVEPGELLVLLGPSGCGKTTTLRTIAGLESVTDGSVAIGGQDVSLTTPQNRDVAMVFQNYALYPHKTVRGNILFPLRKMDLDEEAMEERVNSTARLLDIADLLEKKPAALSGGQRQRVAVGRAIARRPSVLLMDEPLSNLDAKLRVQTRSDFRDLQQRLGITTVYVTHDQEEAMSIADRLVVMNDGRVAQSGTPESVYRTPDSEFVASFLGDPSMNLFDADGAGPVVEALTRDRPAECRRVGVRPEDAHLVDDDGTVVGDEPVSTTATVECEVLVVEPIGRAYELTLSAGEDRSTDEDRSAGEDHSAGGDRFVARTRTRPTWLREGRRVTVTFDGERVTCFDGDGRRIDRG